MTKLLLAEMQRKVESFANPNMYGKLNKNIWKNIAESINTHGYNLTADNCYIKWTGMKKKYKTIKDAKKQTGAAKQTWEYFDIINDILGKNPAIVPLSTASNIRGFMINQNVLHSSDEEEHCENEENELNVVSTNVLKNRQIRKRKSKASMEKLIEQRERHHQQNYNQRERLLSLLEERFKTSEENRKKSKNQI